MISIQLCAMPGIGKKVVRDYFFLGNQEKRVREGVGSFLVSKSNAGKGFGCLYYGLVGSIQVGATAGFNLGVSSVFISVGEDALELLFADLAGFGAIVVSVTDDEAV